MRIIFAGTPDFAAIALEALIGAGHDLQLVLTQPDRPAGRGLKSQSSPVKRLALAQGLAVAQPVKLTMAGSDEVAAAVAAMDAVRADVMVVAAYGLILPKTVLALPRLGCLNIHASLLPRWRGAAPVQRALLAGDAESGITIMQMDEGLDTGAMLLKEALAIGPEETAGELHDRLAALGARLIVEALARPLKPQAQDGALATYAAKLTKDEALIDWREDAAGIARKVRAYNPFPGAATALAGERLKIWRARAIATAAESAAPGTLLGGGVRDGHGGGVRVACAGGVLEILELQRAGGKRMPAEAFLAGFKPPAGARLGAW